jgi:Putative beta-barrel porin 2
VIAHGIRPESRPTQSVRGPKSAGNASIMVMLSLACGLSSRPVSAELKYDIGAASRYEYATNVFDLPSGYGANGPSGGQRSDSYYTYGVQGNLDYLAGRQDFFLSGTDTEFKYDHFSQLSHNEYALDGGWRWQLGSVWDGTVEVLRSRIMVEFADLNQLNLSVLTDQREKASVRLRFVPDWRIGVSGYAHDMQEPLAGAPNLELKENQGAVTLDYLGVSHLTAGVSAAYLEGQYSGNTTATENLFDGRYHETDEGLVASYQLSGKSTFGLQAGYSERSSPLATNSLSGFTGNLSLIEQLSGKTSVTFRISRAIENYIANTASEIDTTGHIDVNWQATYKTRFTVGYDYMIRNLPDEGLVQGSDRIDHAQNATVGIDWEAQRWLSIKPYARFQTRHSNVSNYQFSGNVYGVNVFLQTKNF